MSEPIRSYTTTSDSRRGLGELRVLWQRTRSGARRMPDEVRGVLEHIRHAESLVQSLTGMVVAGKDVLEVGPGQLPRQLAYFALRNRVVGLDLDVIPRGFDPAAYLRLWRSNGTLRLVKTLARKLLRFDAKFEREMARQCGVRRLPAPRIVAGDATRMDFADASFDFVYSFSVFEHLPDPAAVLREAVRVIRPGGVILTHLHLYTSDNGNHDLRITPFGREGLPFWAHLRPQHEKAVHPFAYINRLRLAEWRRLCQHELSGCRFDAELDGEVHRAELARLREAGELADYSDEELLTRNLIIVWQAAP